MRSAHTLLEELIDHETMDGMQMRATGIVLRDLGPITTLQPGLFSFEEDCAIQKLNKTVFSLKQRYGKESITLGTYTAKNSPIYKKTKERSPYFSSTK